MKQQPGLRNGIGLSKVTLVLISEVWGALCDGRGGHSRRGSRRARALRGNRLASLRKRKKVNMLVDRCGHSVLNGRGGGKGMSG